MFWLDDFEDGIDGGDWTTSGSVSASGGQAHITGTGTWGDWLWRDQTTEDGQGARFMFRISTTSALTRLSFRRGTWGTSTYRKWGLLLEGGKIKSESKLGTAAEVKVDLLTLEANTWYEALVEIDGGDHLRVQVWERDDPSVWAEDVRSGSQDWDDLTWEFLFQLHTGTLDIEEYMEYEVNALGLRSSMDDDSGLTSWLYDVRGRLIEEEKVITGGGTFLTQWAYDDGDRLASMTYPGGTSGQGGEEVDFTYHPQGLIDSVIGDSTYVKAGTEYDEAFRLTERTLGNSVLQTTFGYYGWTTSNGRGRLNWINTGTTGDPDSVQDLTYTYDANGNVLTIVDANAGGTQTQTFTYDDLDRLYTAQASGGTGGTYSQETYTYSSSTGNLASKAGVTYTYGDSDHPHAVTSTNSGWSFGYEENGNQDERHHGADDLTLEYDEENRLITVSGDASATFVYDGDGNRVKGTVEGTTTIYVGDHYELETGTSTVRKYYYAGGSRVAMREDSTLYWLFSDHLGSTAITAEDDGTKYAELRYKAWGEERYSSGTTPTTYQYTGQRIEESLGIYYYRARWYDPELGRWIQPDTIVPGPGNPQAYNRYAYVQSNPTRYSDPSGHYLCADTHGGEYCQPFPHIRLTTFGWAGYIGYLTLKGISDAWWDTELEDTEVKAITIYYEGGTELRYDNRGVWYFPSVLRESINRQWNRYCSARSDSFGCINFFWGYYEPLHIGGAGDEMLLEILEYDLYDHPLYGDVAIRTARQMTRSIGGIKEDRPGGNVTLLLSDNPNSLRQLRNIREGAGTSQAFYICWWPTPAGSQQCQYSEQARSLFLVLSPNQHLYLCEILPGVSPPCNLTGAN